MLFSEPKIPQSSRSNRQRTPPRCFSALQRAENSSNGFRRDAHQTLAEFQCSSASRKFLKSGSRRRAVYARRCFSALQRAENSSNCAITRSYGSPNGFSALQRAENSSKTVRALDADGRIWFQCSSASRKFLKQKLRIKKLSKTSVSVLFSEPKIPQKRSVALPSFDFDRFSALQRAENSSKAPDRRGAVAV